jgi:putative DNA primase/helicase
VGTHCRPLRPSIVAAETAAYFSEQDTFAQWLDEECDCEPGNEWKSECVADLWRSWEGYAKTANEPTGSQKSFSANLAKRRFEKHKGGKGVRYFRGISLRRVAGGG